MRFPRTLAMLGVALSTLIFPGYAQQARQDSAALASAVSTLKNDLRNYVTAQEQYYRSQHLRRYCSGHDAEAKPRGHRGRIDLLAQGAQRRRDSQRRARSRLRDLGRLAFTTAR